VQAQQGHQHKAPGNDQIDSNRATEAPGGFMSDLFDATAGFEDSLEVFNPPPESIPTQTLNGIFSGTDSDGRQQKPLDRLRSFRRSRFDSMNDPDVHGIFSGMISGGMKLNPLVAHF